MTRPVEPRRIDPIGVVESVLEDVAAAPRQVAEAAPEAWLVIREEYVPALEGLAVGDEVYLLTWLHLADRKRLVVHPHGDPARRERGVFSLRSPHRPNPIGLHRVTVARIEGNRLLVRHLEAVNGTPLIDIKPVLPAERDG
jgi:tRNA-Thr(GGU) m(6)t(6)A37 methyltransferase TsaA